MDVRFHGAAREVTGSCHIVSVAGKTVLLDCGMFQGRREEARAKNAAIPLPPGEIDAVILSHAHIDHAGRLPFLIREGYSGPIFCTPATRDLCAIMLADSAHIQEKDARFLARRNKPYVAPLYEQRDVLQAIKQMVSYPYGREFEATANIHATFYDAGHILGSASVSVDAVEGSRRSRLVFSGDVGRWGLPIIRDPQPPPHAAAVIMESTYGNRDHASVADMPERLAAIVRETAARGGRVVIPAFALGRTQELVYDLHRQARDGKIPAIPIYIDSPLAIDATTVFAAHPEIFDATEDFIAKVRELFTFDLVHYTRDVSESKALNVQRGPMIVIAASGMAESGRILHHLLHSAPDPRSTILIVGFQAEHTTGRRIVERQPMLRILGEQVPLRASVEVLNGYSAHADRTELRRWLKGVRTEQGTAPPVWLVHGEPAAQDALAALLREDDHEVATPAPGDTATL